MTTACTPEELAWFKLRNYDGLASATTLDWAWTIHDRVRLKQLFEKKPRPSAHLAELFARLQKSPLKPLGFGLSGFAGNPLDTPTVKLLTVRRINRLTQLLNKIDVEYEDSSRPVDELLPADSLEEGEFVHLVIDPHTTKAKLLADFKIFLNNWYGKFGATVPNGDYGDAKLRGWHALRVIPYFDLQFFAAIHNRRITPRTLADLLDLGYVDAGGPGKVALDNLATRVTEVISLDCFHTLLTFEDRDPNRSKTFGTIFPKK